MIAFFTDKGSACPISNYDLMKDQESFIVVSYEIGTFLFEKYLRSLLRLTKPTIVSINRMERSPKLMKGQVTMRTLVLNTLKNSMWTRACFNGRLSSVRPDYAQISFIALAEDLYQEKKPEIFIAGRLCRGNPTGI